jgi:hypothetical protein
MTRDMEMENISLKIGPLSMKENGRMTRRMVKENICMLMGQFMKVIGRMVRKAEKESWYLPTELSMKGAGMAVKEKLQVPVNLSLGIEKSLDTKQAVRSWFAQFCILFHRNWYQYIRNYDTILITLVVAILLAVFTGGGIWRSIGHDARSVPLRVPALFFICVTQGIVGSLQSVNSFPGERAIMLRERQAGAYQTSSYFAAKSAVDLLVQAWPTFIFCCIVYPMIGFRNGAGHFFLFCYFVIMNAFSAVSLASVGKTKYITFLF